MKNCGKMSGAREELDKSVREERIESRHSIKSFEGLGSRSHDMGLELRRHFSTVDCDTSLNDEKLQYLYN